MEEWKRSLPELPEARRERYGKELGLSDYDAGVLAGEKALADYYEGALAVFPAGDRKAAAKPIVNWLTSELLGRLNGLKKDISESPVPSRHLGELVSLVVKAVINSKAAKLVFDEMFSGGGSPEEIVKKKGLVQVEDEPQIKSWVDEILAANPKIVADVKGGKEAAVGSLVGQVMKKSSGRANPQTVNKLLRKAILG